MPMLPYEERKRNFTLIELGYLKEQAQRESARCLQCACPAAGQCDLQKYSIEHGLADNRFHDGEPSDYHDYDVDLSHSFILRDPNKCINCTQCVRVCHDVIGPDCYGMFGKGFDTIVATPFNVSLHDTDCVSCGACVQVCPTGSLMMAERTLKRYAFALDRLSSVAIVSRFVLTEHWARRQTSSFLSSIVLVPISHWRRETWRTRQITWYASVCHVGRKICR